MSSLKLEYVWIQVYLEKLVKGSLKERVHALFSFYDTGRTNSICYFDIITMVIEKLFRCSVIRKIKLKRLLMMKSLLLH